MSFSWRERLKRAKKRLLDRLDIEESQKEEVWKYIWENIGSFCKESDDQVRLVFGERCNIDEEVEKLYQDEFDEMALDIIEKVLEQLGFKLKKKSKKKKKKVVKDEQTDKDVETDSDSDSDSDADSEQQEQEVEAIAH